MVQEALKAALEQPEQEPVAWFNGKPVYSAPPRREWRGLTEEEIRPLSTNCYDGTLTDPLILFARAVEQALKEKNHE